MDSKAYYNQPALWKRDMLPEDHEKLRILRKFIPDDVHTILDVGCGNGAVTNVLPENYDITGFDFSEEALTHFKHKKVLGSTEQLPFDDQSFDLVLTMDTLEHIKPDHYEQTLKELERVAKKYIVVICPHNEKLYERQIQCEYCETIFHVHWHLRSVKYKDLFGCFESLTPEAYTLYSGKWATGGDKFLKQIWLRDGDETVQFHGAVCPMCGRHQVSGREKSIVERMRAAYFRRIDERINNYLSPTESQVAILFSKGEKTQSDQIKQLNNIEQMILEVNLHNADIVQTKLEVKHRYKLDFCDVEATSENSLIMPENAYVIVNSNTDWGESIEIEGKSARCYENCGGLDGHALFVLPDLPGETEFTIEYYDRAEEPIYVQVYDIDNGYQTIGQLELTQANQWKVSHYSIPAELKHGNAGWILRLVTNKNHPMESHPISRIYAGTFQESITRNIPKHQDSFTIPMEWNSNYFSYSIQIEYKNNGVELFDRTPYIIQDGVPYVLLETEHSSNDCVKTYQIPTWLVKNKQKYTIS